MFSSFVSPRQVKIGDAAAFAGTTPRAIRHYHDIGVLPEPERGSDGRRRYGYDEMIRLLWIRKMADAGVALEDIRGAFADDAGGDADAAGNGGAGGDGGADGDRAPIDPQVTRVLDRLESTLVAKEAELRRQRAAVQRMRTRGSRLGLLDDIVAGRLESLPEGSVRRDGLDTLLVTERMLGPLAAAMQAGRFVALATHPVLREESDRVDAAEEALDDTVAVDDPRVAQVAAERHAFEEALQAAIEASGQDEEDDAILDAWDELHPAGDDAIDGAGAVDAVGGAVGGAVDADGRGAGPRRMSAAEAISKMPYDYSPARWRSMELALELGAPDPSAPDPSAPSATL